MSRVITDSPDPGGVVVGFDLDMTLIDSRPGIAAVWRRIAAETGVELDVDAIVSRLGPPLEVETANWFPAARVTSVANRYRELYADIAIAPTAALPGARDALQAIRAAGGRTMVVTAKNEQAARGHVEHLGLPVDTVVGGRWSDAKGEALRAHGAVGYVGDQPADMRGAHVADAYAIGVSTGSASAAELREAGAHLVLDDLTGLTGWLDEGGLGVLTERYRDRVAAPPTSDSAPLERL